MAEFYCKAFWAFTY